MTTSIKPIVWSIAGFDPCAGAGVQADLKTIEDFDCHACTVVSLLTAQNETTISEVEAVSSEFFSAQLYNLIETQKPVAIKIGVLPNVQLAQRLFDFLKEFAIDFVIYDPIIRSSSNFEFSNAKQQLEILNCLAPVVDLVTPNLPECEILFGTGMSIINYAKRFLELGFKAVLIKGGHNSDECCHDFYYDDQQQYFLSNHKIENKDIHGTGCCFSAAIAANVANNYELADALVIAKMYLSQGIEQANKSYFCHAGFPKAQKYLPWRSKTAKEQQLSFPSCGPLGFYVIVDNADWVERLASNNVKTIQLRMKNKTIIEVEKEIISAKKIAEKYQIKLFINDYWELAIQHKIYGVHLGQEDLTSANLTAIREAGLRLGISTHSFYEVANAYYFQPSYYAFGPIFATTTKIMKFSPRGLQSLRYWRDLLNAPMTAIGGINLQNLHQVLDTKVESVAVISAVTKSQNPEQSIKHFFQALKNI